MLNFILFFLTLSIKPVYAAPASPTPSPAPTLTTAPNEIQKLRQAVQDKVREKLKEITATSPVNSKKGYVGTITAINPTEISISIKNQERQLNIAEDTVYIDSKRNKTKYENLKVGQDILAMGLINENGGLNAKRIVLVDMKTIVNTTQITIGQIVDISKSSNLFVIVPSNHKDNQYQIKYDTKTEMVDKSGIKVAQSNLKTGDKVIVILTPDPKVPKTFTAGKIITLTENPKTTPTPSVQSIPRN